jgi:AcrR family transcriptional regulator
VLAATTAELLVSGPTGATISAIASRAGVHETSIYRRWTTRESLLLDAATEQSAISVPAPDTGSLRGDLIAIVLSVDEFLSTPAGAVLAHAAAVASAPGEIAARTSFWSTRLSSRREVVERAAARGEIRPDVDADLLMRAVVAPPHLRQVLGGEAFTSDTAAALVDLILAGASPRS